MGTAGGDAGDEYIGTGAEEHAVSRRKVRGKVADRAGQAGATAAYAAGENGESE